jgi:hypothetical protein
MPTTVAVRVQGRGGFDSPTATRERMRSQRVSAGAHPRGFSCTTHEPQKKDPLNGGLSFVASEGFEPPKAEPSDLQSDPFGR